MKLSLTTAEMLAELELVQDDEENQLAQEAMETVAALLAQVGFPPDLARKLFHEVWDAGRVAGAQQRERVLAKAEADILRAARAAGLHFSGEPDDPLLT